MIDIKTVPITVALLIVLHHCAHAQTSANKINCDLSYKAIMEQNRVDKLDWVKRWFNTYNKSPAREWIEGWKNEPLVSWVLIEHPNFHAAERTTLWLAKTKSRAVYWESVQSDYHSVKEIDERTQRSEIAMEIYDKFFQNVSIWKQAEILKPKIPIDRMSPEFWGFLSVSSPTSPCKQILLGMDDFMKCPDKKCEPGPERLGRVMTALSPILDANGD